VKEQCGGAQQLIMTVWLIYGLKLRLAIKWSFRLILHLNHKNFLSKKFFAKHGMAELKKYEFGWINDIGSGFITYCNHSLAKERPITKECDKGRT